MIKRVMIACLCLALAVSHLNAVEIDRFQEAFALGDREQALKELIPGTNDFYFYHALDAQHRRDHARFDQLIRDWAQQIRSSSQRDRLLLRQAVIKFDSDPQGSVADLVNRLGLRFQHRAPRLGQEANIPHTLNQDVISYASFMREAKRRSSNAFQYIQETHLCEIDASRLAMNDLRDYLRRLPFPRAPHFIDILIKELNDRHSGGFGSLNIHKQLLLDQLHQLRQRLPSLASNQVYVQEVLKRMQPRDGSDWESNPQSYGAYLERLWSFVDALPAAHNSLKAHLLYHQLVHERSQGRFNQALFTQYIQLPRNERYMNNQYVRKFRSHHANLKADFKRFTLLTPAYGDQELVESYLQHFFAQGQLPQAFASYLDERYLERLFAEVQVLNGDGDQERWASVLGATQYRAIQQRIELALTPQNQLRYAAGDDVRLQLQVKNVEKLLVRVYPINTLAWYRDNQRAVPTNFDVDGLVTKYEQELSYDHHPARRHIEQIHLPSIKKRGVYIVECIGNGYRCRSVLRIGQLTVRERLGTAGHVFRIYDDDHKLVKDAQIEFGNQHFQADKNGSILVPFSTSGDANKQIIVRDGDFAVRHDFYHRQEQYKLELSAFIDRQHALAGQLAKIVIKPRMFLQQEPVSLADLEDLTLHITATTIDGIKAREVLRDFTLNEVDAFAHEFRFPERVQSVHVELRAEIEQVSTGARQSLQASHSMSFNGMLQAQTFKDIYLQQIDGQYVIDILGRNGETYPSHQVVNCEFQHRLFERSIHQQLRCDDQGRIHLGALSDIAFVKVRLDDITRHWDLKAADQRQASRYHVLTGQKLQLAWSYTANDLKRAHLYSLRGEAWSENHQKALRLDASGRLEIAALPAGDYKLYLPHQRGAIHLAVEEALEQDAQFFAAARILDATAPHGLHVGILQRDQKHVRIQVHGASQATRVHVLMNRYQDGVHLIDHFADLSFRGQTVYHPAIEMNHYLDKSKLSDEHRYVLDRRYERIFPSLALQRPALLLNPWQRSSTNTQNIGTDDGESFGDYEKRGGAGKAFGGYGGRRAMDGSGASLYDFMSHTSLFLHNLGVNNNGILEIPLELIADQQHLQILAIEPEQAAWRQFSIGGKDLERRDRRHVLRADTGDTQEEKMVSVVAAGQSVAVNSDPSAWRLLQRFDEAFDLLDTLCDDQRLQDFHFLKRWPELSEEEKDRYYSEHAAHEMHVFLYYKDRAFFDAVVKPSLANKHDQTFIDRFLLEQDLSSYLRPWAFERLNAFEQILLMRRSPDAAADILRSVRERHALQFYEPQELDRLFATALHGKALDAAAFMAIGADGASANRARLLKTESARRYNRRKEVADKKAMAADMEVALEEVEEDLPSVVAPAAPQEKGQYFAQDRRNGLRGRRLYRQVDQTKEWAENNYYKRYPHEQLFDLVPLNAFWLDWALHSEGAFLSQHLAMAHENASSVLLALAISDLPFSADAPQVRVENGQTEVITKSAGLLFNVQVSPAIFNQDDAALLMSQQLYRVSDRYRYEDNQQIEKYVKGDLLYRDVYGMQLIVTNPSARPQRIEVLHQIPAGAIALSGHKASTNKAVSLAAYSVQRFDVLFYFPETGAFPMQAASASNNGTLVGRAIGKTVQVVDELPDLDKTSWSYIASYATDKEVLQFLAEHNVHRLDLKRIAFRMHDREMFEQTIQALEAARQYEPVLWSYGFKHQHLKAMRDCLEHDERVANACGAYVSSGLLQLDAVERFDYEHLEYYPLVNARRHAVGGQLQIANDALAQQYQAFLASVQYIPQLRQQDHFIAVIYLLAQDRVEDALKHFAQIEAADTHQQLQYDYTKAYLALLQEDLKTAAEICERYRQLPVKHWRERFVAMQQQIKEVHGQEVPVEDPNRNQDIEQQAANTPSLSLDTSGTSIVIHQQHLDSCLVKLYRMDLELLFSNNPFMRGQGGQFAYIEANHQETLELKEGPAGTVYALPEAFKKGNVMIEIEAASIRRRSVLFVHQLQVMAQESYAQLQVQRKGRNDRVSKAYVKVYAKMQGGAVKFYKDGYTDFRGRFDYGAISTSDLNQVQRFALYIAHPEYGALVMELDPPQR